MSFLVLGFGSVEKSAEAESNNGCKGNKCQKGQGFKGAFHWLAFPQSGRTRSPRT